MYKPRTLLRSVALLASALVFATTAVAAEKWRAYTYNTTATVTANVGLLNLFEKIKQETNGELEIELFLGGTLQINSADITAAVSDNIVQFGDDAFFTGNVPVGNLVRMPFMINTLDEYKAMEAFVWPHLETAYAEKGVVLLGQYTYAPAVFFSKKEVRSLEDLKGLKIRSASAEQAAIIQRFGGIPVTISTPEVAEAVDRGVIDAAMTVSGTAANIWADTFDYRYQLKVNYTNAPLIASKEAFDKLSPEVQETVRRLTREAGVWITDTLAAQEDEMTQKLVSEHGLVNTIADEATVAKLQANMPSFWEDWAKAQGPEIEALLAEMRAQLGR
mgnify:CR=1 FL=1